MKHITITDHAVYRYAERVMGFDLDAAKTYILKKHGQQLSAAAAMGARSIQLDGVHYILEDGHLITVLVNSDPVDRGNHQARKEKAA